MKKKLLAAILLVGSCGFAQFPIINYYGNLNFTPENANGNSQRVYNRVVSAVPLDHTAAGANLIWNFTQLSPIGTSFYQNFLPTAAQSAQYFEISNVTENWTTINSETFHSKTFINGGGTIVGVENETFSLNYTKDEAAFAANWNLNYGDTHSDTTAGIYTYDGYQGTFTGTISSAVDAYGILNLDGSGWDTTSDEVVRLKITESMALQYPGIGTVGTAIFTKYHYYRENDRFPFFTEVTSTFDIPVLSVAQTITLLEAANPSLTLDASQFDENSCVLAPNPANDFISISSDGVTIESITIADVNGRMVSTKKYPGESIDISALEKGVYFLSIATANGATIKKIIKE